MRRIALQAYKSLIDLISAQPAAKHSHLRERALDDVDTRADSVTVPIACKKV
jgi:hypothetical protein